MPRLNVSILLSEAFSNMLLACLLEPLRVVRYSLENEISWSILTYDDAPVTSSSGIQVAPDIPQAEAPKSDLVLLVGGDRFRDEAGRVEVRRSLRNPRYGGVMIGAGTGSWLMAASGLLDGRKATVHWQLHSEFEETFLEVQASTDRFVRDGRMWTCGSAANALDLILLFIDEYYGPAVAMDASAMFLHDSSRQAERAEQTASLPALGGRGSGRLRKLLSLMADTLEDPLPLCELAGFAKMSERSLARLFNSELGVPPGRYYQTLRLARARDLAAHSDLALDEIALRCGFSSASGLRKAHRKQYGTPLRTR